MFENNPIPEFISDETFEKLNQENVLCENGVRNYLIRKKYKKLREEKIRSGKAIDTIREDYPYLQFDTIRKIVHQRKK